MKTITQFYDYFKKSLIEKRKKKNVNYKILIYSKIGFDEESDVNLNIENNNNIYQLNLKEIFIFSKEGNILFHYSFNKGNKKTKKEILIILKIINHLYSFETNNDNSNNEISFNQLFINNEKIFIIKVEKNNLIIVSIFK